MLQDVLKNVLKPSQRRKMVIGLVSDCISLRRVCEVSLLSTSVWYYRAHRREDLPIRQRIRDIAQTRVRYGLWRIYVLLRREGWRDNHKRVYRIYKEGGICGSSAHGDVGRLPHRSEPPSFSSLHDRWSMELASLLLRGCR